MDDLRAEVRLVSYLRLAVEAFQDAAARLQRAYLVVLEAGRAHLVRYVAGVRVRLQSVNEFTHRRFGAFVVPFPLLDAIDRFLGALKLCYFDLKRRDLALKARQLGLRAAKLERELAHLHGRFRRKFPPIEEGAELFEQRLGAADRPGGVGGEFEDSSEIDGQERLSGTPSVTRNGGTC